MITGRDFIIKGRHFTTICRDFHDFRSIILAKFRSAREVSPYLALMSNCQTM